jgi:hypothetical protein
MYARGVMNEAAVPIGIPAIALLAPVRAMARWN